MRKGDREIGFGFVVAFLTTFLFGTLFWTVHFANAWDTNVGRMIATVDILMEKAYGLAVPEKR